MPRGTDREERLRRNFGRIYPGHVRAFSRFLIQLRRHFGGDLDLLVIVAAIADRTRPDAWSPRLTDPGRLTLGPQDRTHQAPINTLSLSDYTGIPRETMRRKLDRLAALGWVERNDRGHLRLTSSAGQDLQGATADTLAYLEAVLDLHETLADPGPDGGRGAPPG